MLRLSPNFQPVDNSHDLPLRSYSATFFRDFYDNKWASILMVVASYPGSESMKLGRPKDKTLTIWVLITGEFS